MAGASNVAAASLTAANRRRVRQVLKGLGYAAALVAIALMLGVVYIAAYRNGWAS